MKNLIKQIKKKFIQYDYKKENKKLKESIIKLEEQIVKLEDYVDNDLNVHRIKDLRSALDHEREIKRKLRTEIIELKKELNK